MTPRASIKIGLVSLGCAKNLVDSEVMLGLLARDGMTLTERAEDADVLIVNTCGFIDKAKQESIDTILKLNQLRETGHCKALIMTGCLTQRYPQELRRELPEVDAIVGLNEVPQIPAIVRQVLEKVGQASRLSAGPPRGDRRDAGPTMYWSGPAKYVPDFSAPRLRLTPKHTAYVKIAEGCNHPCAFCSIPRIRGRYRSRPLDDVLAEIRALVAADCREINLISQDTTFYGRDLTGGQELLSELLRRAQAIPGDFWLRLLYTHPAHWTDELITTIASCDKVCRYVDMPLQHINDGMLTAMKRETSGQYIRDLLGRIRVGVPGITLRTTLIVGFPGETAAQFQELLKFIETARFERLGVFAYSQEDHTPAGNLERQLSARVKATRRGKTLALQQKISRQVQRQFVGQTVRVLVEKSTPSGWQGRSVADAPEIDGTVIGVGSAPIGEFAEVQITGSTIYDLKGRIIQHGSKI